MNILASRRAKIVARVKGDAWHLNVSRETLESVVHPNDIDLLNNPIPSGRIRVKSVRGFMKLMKEFRGQ